MEKKFYQKTWFIVLSLIFFFPVGIYLMWKYTSWSKKAKSIATVVVLIYGLIIILSDEDTSETAESKDPESVTAAVEEKQKTEVESEQEVKEEPDEEQQEVVEEKELTIDELVHKAIVDAVGKKTNMDNDRIIDIQVNDHLGTEEDNDYIIIAKLFANENLTANMTRKGILKQSTEVFEPLFSTDGVTEVVLMWHLTLVDAYGNEKDDTVVKVTLSKETADKINWDNFDYNNYTTIADDYWHHAAVGK
jgi:uncharacterized membrane protein